MQHTPLIEMTRGETLGNQHFGSVAVVNTRGQLRAFAGDPHWLTFTRSTLKALQALPFMQAGGGDWVTKVGADGVQVVGSKSRGEAFALKIIDANKPALFAASVEVMEQLGWLDDAQREALKPWRAQPIINARGLQVGQRRPVFTLQTP